MLVLAAAALSACGGDDNGTANTGSSSNGAGSGNSGTGGTGSGNGNGNGGTTQPAVVKPLAGGSLYVGAVSFGDTVSIELDQPAAGQLTLRFLDSRFGLAGTLVGQYSVDGNTYRVKNLAASSNDVPAALATAASTVTFSFTLDDSVLSGALGQVPNLVAGNGALLQGYVSAANRGAQLADIAGTYSYMRQAGGTAIAGQLGIQSDGSVRVCAGQSYSATCAGGQSGQLSPDADQVRYPGAFSLTVAGAKVGRLFVGRQQGSVALFVDETGAGSSSIPGSWVVRSAAPVTANGINGDWLCAEPELDSKNVGTGRTRRNIVSIAGNTLAADNIPSDVTLTYNSLAGSTTNGLVSGSWQETVNGLSQSAGLAWLPVSNKLAYQLRQVPGSQQLLPGVCAPLPAAAPVSTYLSAKANDVILVTLADLRPTQPAIGRDQIYYKLGRYAADPVKRFDDVCEANGQNKTKTSDANSRIDTLASFTCTKAIGDKPADMKTLVVGPYGEPYLTDGHHTFTSLWEAVSGGPQTKIYVRVQDNLSTLSRAAFFRTLRERKLVWSKDGDRPSYPADLPRSLGLGNGLNDDPYRALVYFARDIGYQQLADATEFTEFYWGDWLRTVVDLKKVNLNDTPSYLTAVHAAAEAMVALTPDTVVSNGKTAASLGRLDALNETEFTALSQPLGSAKPGKLPYAVDYRLKLTH